MRISPSVIFRHFDFTPLIQDASIKQFTLRHKRNLRVLLLDTRRFLQLYVSLVLAEEGLTYVLLLLGHLVLSVIICDLISLNTIDDSLARNFIILQDMWCYDLLYRFFRQFMQWESLRVGAGWVFKFE